VREEVLNAHAELGQALIQARLYEKAASLARRNYEVQQKEYGFGLINNLNLLDIQQDLKNLEIQRLRAFANAKQSEIRLKIVSGQGL
jgi:outer membrane protein TolC